MTEHSTDIAKVAYECTINELFGDVPPSRLEEMEAPEYLRIKRLQKGFSDRCLEVNRAMRRELVDNSPYDEFIDIAPIAFDDQAQCFIAGVEDRHYFFWVH